MSATARKQPAYGYISPEQQALMDRCEARIRERRAAASYTVLMRSADKEVGAVNCARCDRIGDFSAEGQRGWCMFLRHMVSTWHPCRCDAFKAAA